MNEYTCTDIPQLCEEITEKYSDLLGPLPLKLPPFREISHEIALIDESKQLKHRLPKCPEAFRSELTRKLSDTLPQGGGCQQLQNKRHLCCVYQRKMVH